jgi:hypothetical protein
MCLPAISYIKTRLGMIKVSSLIRWTSELLTETDPGQTVCFAVMLLILDNIYPLELVSCGCSLGYLSAVVGSF